MAPLPTSCARWEELMAYNPIPDGELAAIVTYLEMHEPPSVQVPPGKLSLRRMTQPALDDYRRLFRQIGARWLWFSRLIRTDTELAAIIHDPAVRIFAVVDENGADVGILE